MVQWVYFLSYHEQCCLLDLFFLLLQHTVVGCCCVKASTCQWVSDLWSSRILSMHLMPSRDIRFVEPSVWGRACRICWCQILWLLKWESSTLVASGCTQFVTELSSGMLVMKEHVYRRYSSALLYAGFDCSANVFWLSVVSILSLVHMVSDSQWDSHALCPQGSLNTIVLGKLTSCAAVIAVLRKGTTLSVSVVFVLTCYVPYWSMWSAHLVL